MMARPRARRPAPAKSVPIIASRVGLRIIPYNLPETTLVIASESETGAIRTPDRSGGRFETD